MISDALRALRRRPDPTPAPIVRTKELEVTQAIVSLLLSSGPLPSVTLYSNHRQEGLSGSRALCVARALTAAFAGRAAEAIPELRRVLRSLDFEIKGADRRDITHLRLLQALASALLALRMAQAGQDARGAHGTSAAAEIARAASTGLPDEPYLLHLYARTLITLGRRREAAGLLEGVVDAPWLGGWSRAFKDLIEESRRPVRFPSREALAAHLRERLSSPMAEAELGDTLNASAGNTAYPVSRAPALELFVSQKDYAELSDADLLIGRPNPSQDQPTPPTIISLREKLHERFGVSLPGVQLLVDANLLSGHAIAVMDKKTATTSVADLSEADDAEAWWPSASTAPNPLKALLVVALRFLFRMPRSLPALSREEDEAHGLMLADRMPYMLLAAKLKIALASGIDPAAAVATSRLGEPEAEPLWGNELRPSRTKLLLSRGDEDALVAATVPGLGIAASQDLFVRIAGSLKGWNAAAQRANARMPALVVRDTLLRPSVRQLLQDSFPDTPILALAELDALDAPQPIPIDAPPSIPAPKEIAAQPSSAVSATQS